MRKCGMMPDKLVRECGNEKLRDAERIEFGREWCRKEKNGNAIECGMGLSGKMAKCPFF